MQRTWFSRPILAGIIATIAMTLLMYKSPLAGMPKMDIAVMLGALFNSGHAPAPHSSVWWMGMAFHFINGALIFPLIYANVLFAQLPGAPWFRGSIWGLILWFMAQALFMPIMGTGFFAAKTAAPMLSVAASLACHLIYGAILGAIAGPHSVPAGVPWLGRFRHARQV